MSEEYDPGRVGWRATLRGPSLATLPHEMAVLERYTDHWTRLWAISYEPGVIIPEETTLGWWLLAEFKSRGEAKTYFSHLSHVWAGRTIELVGRRKAEVAAEPPQCPECGCRRIAAGTEVFTPTPDGTKARTLGLKCDECGFRGDVDDFLRKVESDSST